MNSILLIGFMQGRLSSLVNGRIQAFPWDSWRGEFRIAHEHGFRLMEWTLDQAALNENPIMTPAGQKEIQRLMKAHGIVIPSLTGDCFMQAPYYKASGDARQMLLQDFRNIISACGILGIRIVVFPLVDAGRLEKKSQKNDLLSGLRDIKDTLVSCGVQIAFESDFEPNKLARFIELLEPDLFGINYDTGNSAALGYCPAEEIHCYGKRILNVHIKDRLLHGETVPLGSGNADIPCALKALQDCGYSGNYILQTARAADGDHAGALKRYRGMLEGWLKELESK
jgi:hexulose-6-phosphate isomerase